MGFTWLDYAVVAAYLSGVTLAGIFVGGRQRTPEDFFLGGKQLSWWAVGFSIVASETSSLTFISVPGLAYRGNLHFLQLAFGYLFGRLLVSVLFIPAYYRGELLTAYDFLGRRFGVSLRRFTSSVFISTRLLASSVRLFATAIPIHLITGLDYPACILMVGGFTLLYTCVGGLKAVVAMDVVQLFIYLGGAGISVLIIVWQLPQGWHDVIHFATGLGVNKAEVINFYWGEGWLDFFSSPYTLLGGLLGGTFLTMASHGTDQLLVQRLLGCKSRWDSQRALMLDAALIVVQFAFFLLLGLCLFAFYRGVPFPRLGLNSSDEIFPKFIIESLPSGVSGLVVAGVLASAMGTLSSSISALASSTYLDLFKTLFPGLSLSSRREVTISRLFTVFWGVLLIATAMLFRGVRSPVVELGLKIAAVPYGGMLGTFFLGLFFRRADQKDAYVGLTFGLAGMIIVMAFTPIDFTWHTLMGCLLTLVAGGTSALVSRA
jgi:SSS family solute:Na+ symporter